MNAICLNFTMIFMMRDLLGGGATPLECILHLILQTGSGLTPLLS